MLVAWTDGFAQKFPYKLFFLVKAPKDQKCDLRKSIASELLGRRDCDLEVNSRKIKPRFGAQLKHAASEGTLAPRLCWLIKGMSLLWKPDVRENERINKMIGLLDDRAPSATVELKSARASLKYLLGEAGLGGGKSRAKWSEFKSVAANVREECLSGWGSFLDVQCNTSRWEPSKAAPNCMPASKILAMQGQLKPQLKCTSVQHAWAASYNVYVHKLLQQDGGSNKGGFDMFPKVFCVAVREPSKSQASFNFWISCEIVRCRRIVCPVQHETGNGNSQQDGVLVKA